MNNVTRKDVYLRKARRSMRRMRFVIGRLPLWRRRLVFWCGAVVIGLVAALFARMADAAQNIFAAIVDTSHLMPLVVCPVVFAFAAYAANRWFPSTPGSGIPQAIAARNLRDPAARTWLLGSRVIVGKILLTALVLAAGASAGREGPTVQVGAAIMLLCARLAGIGNQSNVVLAGAAAGVAAAFNTPLAGIVFAIEEMARGFGHRHASLVLTAIVLSGAASMSLLGNYNYFGYANADFAFAKVWIPVVAVGLVGGLAGGFFSRLLVDSSRLLRGLRAHARYFKPLQFAALCGVVTALLGLLTHGMTYGTGYLVADNVLHERLSVGWGFTAAKFLATLVTAVSGVPGGIFSPSLSVGAAMGDAMSSWFGYAPVQGIILLGMVSYFAGVTQAPITAFVIVLEITGKGAVPAPLIAAAVISAAAARTLSPQSLYHALAHDFEASARAAAAMVKPAAMPEEAPPPAAPPAA